MMLIYVMRREVCLKHRKIRREIFLRVRVHHRTGSGVCFQFFKNSTRGGRQLAQRGLQNLADPGQHRDAVPNFPSTAG
jgi:hypothetical protein